ncbi:unnamed protein product [Sympodiomycopsis kandeliae]
MDRSSAPRTQNGEGVTGSSNSSNPSSSSGHGHHQQQQQQQQNASSSASTSSHTTQAPSLLGWMKSAFTSPVNRTGSPASGRSSLYRWKDASRTESTAASPVSSTPPRPSINIEQVEGDSHASRIFKRASPNLNTDQSHEAVAGEDEDDDQDEDDSRSDSQTQQDSSEDEQDDDDDDDEELYEPFQAQKPAQQTPTDVTPSPAAPTSGLVKPMARRSVSLDYGGKQDLIHDVARLDLNNAQSIDDPTSASITGSIHKGVVVSDAGGSSSRQSSMQSPPSLILTPPDSRDSEELRSPIVAGWAGPNTPPSDQVPMPSKQQEDGGPESEAAASTQQSREVVALGSRLAAMRSNSRNSDESSSESEDQSPSVSARDREDWDEARAKTPKVFADLYKTASINQVMDSSQQQQSAQSDDAAMDPRQAAAEIAEIATPTPRPTDPRQSSMTPEPSSPKPSIKNVTPLSPGRLRLFGNRRRTDSSAASSDGASSQDKSPEAAVQQGDQTHVRPSLGQRTPSNTPFWRRSRKASSGAVPTTLSPESGPHQALRRSKLQSDLSSSKLSGLSVQALEDASDAMYSADADGRPASIAPSEATSAGAGSRRSRAAKSFGLGGGPGPKRFKSKSKNKSSNDNHFSKLYLAQELYLGIPTPSDRVNLDSNPPSRRPSGSLSSSSTHSSYDNGPQRPPLNTMNSESSLNSTMSSTLASSVMSHSTVGSYGAHGKRNATWAMKFSQDGRYLAVAGQDMVVRVFAVLDTPQKRDVELQEMDIRAEILRRAEKDHMRSSRESLVSSTSGDPNASASEDRSRAKKSSKKSRQDPPLKPIPVFNSRPIREFKGHVSDVLSLDWSKGNFLLSSSMDKTVKIWHLSKPGCLITFGHGDFVTSAVFHPRDDRFFLSGSLDGKLRLWNIAAKRVQATAEVPGLITATSFSASGSTAIAGTFAGALLFYSTEDLSYQSSIAVRSSSNKHSRGRKITGIEAINNLAPSSSNSSVGKGGIQATKMEELILISSNDSRVRVYSLTDKRLTAKYRGSSYLNRTSQIRASSSDDAFVVAGSESGEVYVWDSVGTGSSSSSSTSPLSSAFMRPRRGSKIIHPSSLSSGPISSQSYECWNASDHARPITVALLLPIKSHRHLLSSEDVIETTSEEIISTGTKSTASTLGLTNSLLPSAAIDNNAGNGNSLQQSTGWDPCQNRIVISVDESQVLRVWRAVKDPMAIGLDS